ncbi:MAG TPA: hypothetical protein VKC89_03295 [Patescibacteria group bacterium]|nr:hypothetical protein [Patescibacteria group bacterium]
MVQDQEPTQEPRVLETEQATQAHSREDLAERTKDLDADTKMFISNAGFDLESLIRRWKGKRDSWEEIKGKKVLDLASGSAAASKWQPYFARLCANNGALVTVVDKLPQVGRDKELFRGITTDLVLTVMGENLAEVVGQEEYDVVHSINFIGASPSPELLQELRVLHIKEEDFHMAFSRQAFSLLAEGGVMYLDERDPAKSEDIYYTKKEGTLVRL